MTDRNELERLLAAATEGPWAVYGPPNNQIIWSGPGGLVAFMAHSDGCDVERDKATAALICFLRNNAQHYLSLMDEVERLREALDEDVLEEAISDTLDLDWQPSWAAKEIRRRAALGETHDN